MERVGEPVVIAGPDAAPGEQAVAEADAGPGHVPTRGRTGRGLIQLGG
jgi:hypothetical protein